jgi:hypothetical protein
MQAKTALSSVVAASIAVGAGLFALACSSAPQPDSIFARHTQGESNGSTAEDGGTFNNNGPDPSLGGNTLPAVDSGPACVNLQCQQVGCANGQHTTVSGTIYDPAGKNPLYNVVVYVPNAPTTAFTDHATCDTCAALYTGDPLVTASTASDGTFTLKDVPAGANIPLVIQIGKWRRQITIPTVTSCMDNPLTNKDQTRLPKNRTEGDIPKMAVSTGGSDSLECLLQRIGVDPAEYTSGTGDERVHIFQGTGGNAESGGSPASQTGLWGSEGDLASYDIVILSCEGDEHAETKPATSLQALEAYANAGGRIFASHFHYYWFEGTGSSPEFQSTATWKPGTNSIGSGNDTTSAAINTSFAKGLAFDQWMTLTKSLQADGTLEIDNSRQNASVSPTANPASQAWITDTTVPTMTVNGQTGPTTMYFDFNTPIAAKPADQCGRVVFSDLHVGAASGDYSKGVTTVPAGCTVADLSPQEKALEFMLFDLSSCVTPDSTPPAPPPPAPPAVK